MASHGYDFAPVLHSELGRISAHFAENELAFLALTSKVELPIRDRLAFRLFCRYRDFYVVREWKRVDLAVLSGGPTPAPLMLLEAKALYTFDLVGDDAWIARYPAKVGQDVGKLRGLTDLTTGTRLFALVLATHPTGPIEPNPRQVAKYASGVGKAIETQGHANAVAAKARGYLESRLQQFGQVQTGEISAGEAYGVPVEIHYALVGQSQTPPPLATT